MQNNKVGFSFWYLHFKAFVPVGIQGLFHDGRGVGLITIDRYNCEWIREACSRISSISELRVCYWTTSEYQASCIVYLRNTSRLYRPSAAMTEIEKQIEAMLVICWGAVLAWQPWRKYMFGAGK